MKYLVMLLTLLPIKAQAMAFLITTCGQPVLFIFDFDNEVYIQTAKDIQADPSLHEKFRASIKEDVFLIETSEQAVVVCPDSA